MIVVGAVLLAVIFAFARRPIEAESWKPAVEGLLAVATPCCTEASLWDTLNTVTADGQRPRPASTVEAAQWLNEWPYRARGAQDPPGKEELGVAMQSGEVRCVGAPTGPEVSPTGNEIETLKAIRARRECMYVKWKVWAAETAAERPNERHAVWVDENGFFRGRIDYWK